MIKFVKVIIDRKNNIYENLEHIPEILVLYEKFSKYLYDDYHIQDRKNPIETLIEQIESIGPYFWAIVDEKANKMAGFVFLENWRGAINNPHSAELTTCFDPKYWGKFTKICAKKFIKYCFKKYKLKKLKAQVFEQNYKVKAILKYAGFKKEAVLKGETLKDGKMQNIVIFSIVNKEKKIEVQNEN